MTDSLRIVSDGTATGTRVLMPDGNPIPHVAGVVWTIDVDTGLAQATVVVLGVEIDAVAESGDGVTH